MQGLEKTDTNKRMVVRGGREVRGVTWIRSREK